MDTSIRKIVITEDEDLDLDKLLLGDNSGVANPIPSQPHSSPNASPLLPAVQPISSNNTSSVIKDTPTTPIVVLEEEEEEDDEGLGHWILPKPGAREATSNLKKVPSKSILKKTSSYGNFDLISSQSSNMTNSKKGLASSMTLGNRKGSRLSFTNLLDVSSTSIGSSSGKINNRSQVYNDNQASLDSSISGSGGKKRIKRRTRQASFLSMTSSNSNHSTGSRSNTLGWDLDDSSSGIHQSASAMNSTTSSPRVGKFLLDGLPPPSVPSLSSSTKPQQVVLTSDSGKGKNIVDSADQAAGISGGSSRHSSQASLGDSNSVPRIRRNVSFHSVDVREYDRTVGDNPSCRSGPPLSLDWSYSKKYEKNLEEYELQRSTERATKISQLHVNKYKRRNLLAFHWGHSENELKEARGSTKKIQRQRSMTQLMLPIHLAEEAVISFKKFINKMKGKEEDEIYSDMSNSGSTRDISNSRRGGEDVEIPSSWTA